MAVSISKGTHRAAAGWIDCAPLGRLPETLELLATRAGAETGKPLYNAGDAADSWYRLLTGAACECVLTADGRRQIVNFLLPGDLFGFCARSRHEFSVEIIVDGTAFARYPRRQAEELASADAEVASAIRQRAFESISRLQARMVLLGRTNALEKVSAFLLEMAERPSVGIGDDLVLPMSRYEIADYLAMAVETVSRAITTLKAQGAITLANSRQVRITDRLALEHASAESRRRSSLAPTDASGRVSRTVKLYTSSFASQERATSVRHAG